MVKVIFAKDRPNTEGLPDFWPVEVRAEDDIISEPFVIMTQEELETHKSLHQPLYEAWEESQAHASELRRYAIHRANAYPSVGDQLDMLYKAMKSGVLPVVPEFVQSIDTIKQQFPKPEVQ